MEEEYIIIGDFPNGSKVTHQGVYLPKMGYIQRFTIVRALLLKWHWGHSPVSGFIDNDNRAYIVTIWL